ncbi:MAG: hypothetical protein ACMG6E_08495, partial [Candidatus Roizmanbacteria bacterium]
MKNSLVVIILVIITSVIALRSEVYANSCSNLQNNVCSNCDQGYDSSGTLRSIGSPHIGDLIGKCNDCIGYDVPTQRYHYYDSRTSVIGACTSQEDDTFVPSVVALNTNVYDTWWNGAVPSGCNQDFQCDVGGQGGQCQGNGSGSE